MNASDLIKALQTPCEEGVVHLWKIFIVEPVRRLLRAQVAHHEASAGTQHSKAGAQCPRLVAEMMEGQLAADEIEVAVSERQRGSVGLHPEYVRRLGTGLLKHA